jgi:hypothetical protein
MNRFVKYLVVLSVVAVANMASAQGLVGRDDDLHGAIAVGLSQ